jgi:PEP-CTERM motif-containing protein
MCNRRIVLLAAMLTLPGSAVSASTLITWEFSGAISRGSTHPLVDALYPVGTPLSLTVTFDPASPRIYRPPGPYGLYQAITAATFQLGNATRTVPGGFIGVNCLSILGCPSGGPTDLLSPWVEFLIFPSPYDPPLVPGVPLTWLARLFTEYDDPNVMAGNIPTTPPDGGFGLELSLTDPFHTSLVFWGHIDSVRAIDDVAVVPEPGTFVLLATGLAGLRARRKRRG